MDTFISQHSAIMDRYDLGKHVGLIVDEWGAGTPPNRVTIRPFYISRIRYAMLSWPVVLCISSDQHCDRASYGEHRATGECAPGSVLTDGEKMILTPTYHVFDMFKGHQDAIQLPILLQTQDYTLDGDAIPQLSVSASRNRKGGILVTACNLNARPTRGSALRPARHPRRCCDRAGAHGGVDECVQYVQTPDTVLPIKFDGATLDGNDLTITAAMSIVAVTLS